MPRLGRITGSVLLVVQLLGPDPVRPHAGRVHDVRGRDRKALAGLLLLAHDAGRLAVLLDQLDRGAPFTHTAPKRSASPSTVRTSRESSVWQS